MPITLKRRYTSTNVTVVEPNRPPSALLPVAPQQTADVGDTITVDVSPFFTDPDGDALTYAAVSSNVAIATASVAGSTVTVAGVAEGMATVTVTASDPGGLTASLNMNVTVTAGGGGAEYTPLSGLTITAAGGFRFGFFSTTACVTTRTLVINNTEYTIHWTEWQRSSGSEWSQVPGTRRDGAICGYDLTSAPAGEYRLAGELSIDGVRGRYRSENTVTVGGSGNRAPVAAGSVPAQSLTAGQSAQVNVAPFFNDPDGDPLTYTSASSNTTVATVSVSDSILTVSAVAAGTATVTVNATDPGELSASQTIPVTVTEGGGTSGDRAALVALYNATDGPNWVINENWLTNSPLGEWYGVDTDDSGRVVSLDLSGQWDREAEEYVRHGLSGPIPPELGNLSGLTELSLTANELEGPIPPELGNLANLTELSLHSNRLTGAIPPELGNLANLTELLLGVNDLTGQIPPELGNLANLTVLTLYSNDLTGQIPPELGNLASLTWLPLSDNKLTGPIPPELGNLANLRSLDLGYNDLTGPIPPELGNLSNLSSLWISGNRDLAGPIPSEYQALRLRRFYWNDTGLCSPDNSSFQAWLDAIEDHRGGAVCQDGRDFEAFSGLRINNDGSVTLQVGSITLSAGKAGCMSGGGTLNGRVYDYHWTAWQRNTGSGWSEVSGSRQTGKLCGYDLTSAPSGKYRLVGDMTLAGTRAKYKSENEVTVGGGGSNQSPVTVGTIPAKTVKAGASVSVNASSYFSDPDEDALTYTASSSRNSVATASVSGNSITVTGVAEGTATIEITAWDPGGLSARQSFGVTVESDGGGDFETLSGFRVRSDGGITLQIGAIIQTVGNSGCISGGGTYNGKKWEFHETWWQRDSGSGWQDVPGTRKTGRLCGYDLSSASSGRYRGVGDITAADVRGKYKSENEVSR